MSAVRAGVLFCLAALSPLAVLADDIVLRNGGVIEAPVDAVGPEGLTVGGEAPRVIGWDMVYFVDGDHAEQAQQFSEYSDSVWRARTRLERGDSKLAAELFEPLFDRLLRESIGGPTGLVIAEGTLRCRVASGRHGDAVVAWAAALRIRETGQRLSGESGVEGVIDPLTGLVPVLPPFWLEGSSDAQRFVDLDLSALGTAGTRTDALIELYRVAADRDLSGGIFAPDAAELPQSNRRSADPGVQLLTEILRASSDDSEIRREARGNLMAIVDSESGGWKEAWARFAIGRSLLLEADESSRDAGVLQLLHLPARFSRSQHHLAALALAEAGREMYRRGNEDAAERLRVELNTGYAGHEAIEWLQTELGN